MFLVGAAMVILVAYDVVQTALRIGQRGGPLTLHLASWGWRLVLRFPRLIEKAGVGIPQHRQPYAGGREFAAFRT